MTTWGISDEGFYRPRYDELVTSYEKSWKGRFGANRDTGPKTVDGQIIRFVAEIAAKTWEGIEGAYLSSFVATANWPALRELGVPIIGEPKSEAASEVEWILYGTNATVVPAAHEASLESGSSFSSSASATIGSGGVTWVVLVESNPGVGQVATVTINGTDFDYTVQGGDDLDDIAFGLAALVSFGAEPAGATAIGAFIVLDEEDGDSMTVTATDDDDGSHLATYSGVRVQAAATVTGATAAVAGSTWEIENSVSGWTGVLNDEDAVVGQSDETKAEYLARIRASARYGGITALVLGVDGVTYARTYENDDDVEDGDGRPGHSVEVVVDGGADDDVAQAIWNGRRHGIQTYSDTSDSGTAVDSAGASRTVNFSRVSETDVWCDVTITQGEGWPTSGSPLSAIKSAIVEHINSLGVGDDVTPAGIIKVCIDTVPQVAAAAVLLGTSDPPGSSGVLSISLRNRAVTDSAKVDVA